MSIPVSQTARGIKTIFKPHIAARPLLKIIDDEEGFHLSVMSFNIRGDRRSDTGNRSWDVRKNLISSVINRYFPDILCLQEIQKTDISALYRYTSFIGYPYDNSKPFSYPGIFISCESMLSIMDKGSFWLNETPSLRKPGWGSDHIRSACWLTLDISDIMPEYKIIIINTHFNYQHTRSQIESAKLLCTAVKILGGCHSLPIIVGDFNAPEGSDVYKIFEDAGYIDVFANIEQNISFTYHAFQGLDAEKCYRNVRVDRIYVDHRFTIKKAQVITDHKNGIYPSDHFPIIADLILCKKYGNKIKKDKN